MTETKADVMRERDRLREDNERMRYVTQCLLDAGRCEREAMSMQAQASKHVLDALSHLTMPSIPNN